MKIIFFSRCLFIILLSSIHIIGLAQVSMQDGGNTTASCGGNTIFHDSGGSGGNYSANSTLVHTFCPSLPDRVLRVRFTSYALADQDAFLTIFDGNSINSPPITSITGTNASATFTFYASQPGGCLTFRFTSGSATPLAGWVSIISCQPVGTATPPIWTQTIESQQRTNTGACMVNTCAGSYTDDGGTSGSYSGNVNGNYRTFCPNLPATCLRITFSGTFAIQGTPPNACVDALIVRNGPTQNSPVLGTLCGNTLPSPVTSTDASGCLSFQFFSDALTNQSGWLGSFSCVPCAQSAQTGTLNNDCANATNPPIICGQPPSVTDVGIGPGLASDGCNGCVVSENYTKWYRLRTTSAGKIALDINPSLFSDDYDFAVYGPFPPGGGCSNLGSPVRCSYAANVGTTGMTLTATDKSEDVLGNGFVSAIDAQAGEDYLVMINRWNPGNLNFGVDIPDCFTDPQFACFDCIPLPVEIANFFGRAYKGYNELNWETTQERNVHTYQLEKLIDNRWHQFTQTKANGANTFYAAIDPNPKQGANYYRLKSIDVSGIETVHGQIVEVFSDFSRAPLKIRSNQDVVELELATGLYNGEALEIYDMAGKRILHFELPERIDAPRTFTFVMGERPGGVYVARVGKDTLKFYKN